MRSAMAVAAFAVGLATCSGSTTPKYPALAGTYNAFFTLTFNNSENTGQNGSSGFLGSITLGVPDSKGAFTGSYIYTSGAVGTGTIAGIISTDGNITITQFARRVETVVSASQGLRCGRCHGVISAVTA
jgi:hypothetical protein